jgi:hypothetical protein
MPDNLQGNTSAGGYGGGSISAGSRLPLFRPGRNKRPSPFVAEDLNDDRRRINALMNLKITISESSGSGSGTGQFQVSEDSSNIQLFLPSSSGGGGGTVQMTVYSEQDDYVLCTDPNGVIQAVAKPWILRRSTYAALSPFADDDATHTYTWISISVRTDATPDPSGTGTLTEYAIIRPTYLVNSTLLASIPLGGTGIDITKSWNSGLSTVPTYQEINDNARAWKNVTQICYKNSYVAYIFTDSQPFPTAIT